MLNAEQAMPIYGTLDADWSAKVQGLPDVIDTGVGIAGSNEVIPPFHDSPTAAGWDW